MFSIRKRKGEIMKRLLATVLVCFTGLFVLAGCGSPSTAEDFYGEYSLVKFVKLDTNGEVKDKKEIDNNEVDLVINEELIKFDNDGRREIHGIHIENPEYSYDPEKQELSVSSSGRHYITLKTEGTDIYHNLKEEYGNAAVVFSKH